MEQTLLFQQNNGFMFPITCLSVGPKGRHIAYGASDSTITVIDTRTGKKKQTVEGHEGRITGVSFKDNRYHLLSCSWDQTTRLWDTKESTEPIILKHSSEVKALATALDQSKGAAGARDGEVKVFSLNTLKNLRNLQAHQSEITGVSFIDDGTKLVTTSWNGECRIWDLTSYEIAHELPKLNDRIRSVATTPDGVRIVLGLHSGTILSIDLDSPSEIGKLQGHTDVVEALSIDYTGERLASGSWDRTLRLWSLNSMKEIASGSLLTGITAVEWSPTNEVVYSGDFSGALISWSV
ncbi:WD40 repeat domain-containing protein [Candidatus Thorarchaeota archaeon]|nr:MAG: WD40 repeat domain-containing protein [Candidatus Thorarchaeota archaeon]